MQKFIEKYIKGDKVIWTIIVVLSLYSLVMAYSSSSNLAFRLAGGNVVPFLIKHLLILMIGIVIIIYLQFFNFKYFSRLSQIGIFISIVFTCTQQPFHLPYLSQRPGTRSRSVPRSCQPVPELQPAHVLWICFK